MSTAQGLVTASDFEIPSDFTVIATSPSAMETAQQSLIKWAEKKIYSVITELTDARNERDRAKAHKWNTTGWQKEVLKHEKRVDFYRKIKAALEAGYYIVPPFPIDVFAIRTKATTPRPMLGRNRDNHDQMAQILPAGDGRYVDPKPVRESDTHTEVRKDGSKYEVTDYWATDFREADFPFKVVKAEIREATDRAMALKVFDELGVLPRVRAPDPVVCGRILVPNQTRYRFAEPKAVTFFVAWWLDTRTL